MKILFTLIAASILLLPMSVARADQTADQTELLRIEKGSGAALVAADLKALGEFFSPEWKLVASDASMMSREQMFKAIKEGTLKFAAYEGSDFEVRIYGDAAVVIGTGISKGTWKGEAFTSKERFTDLFVRQDGKWHCVSSHTSDFPEDEDK